MPVPETALRFAPGETRTSISWNSEAASPLSSSMVYCIPWLLSRSTGAPSPARTSSHGRSSAAVTLFFYEIKRGNLVFEQVDTVKFHVFQIKDWYFEVSWFNRSGSNAGWLISNLIYITEKDKKDLIKFYEP